MANLRRVNWRSFILRLFLMTLGALIGAVSVIVFMAPFNIAPGGVSGVAVILNHLFNTPIGLFVLIGNIPIQIIAYRMLGGWRVVAYTVYVVLIYSVAIDVLTPYFPAQGLSENVLLNAIFGGVVGGISSGLVYRAGGTFGGTSTLSRILQRRLGIPMSSSVLYTDMFVIGAAGLVFGWEGALYAAVSLIISGLAADYVLEGPSVIRTAVIITDQPEAVAEVILHGLDRGVTGWEAKGMFTGQEHTLLYVTIGRAQVPDLRRLVFAADPHAFVVVGQGHAAYGSGFKEPRISGWL